MNQPHAGHSSVELLLSFIVFCGVHALSPPFSFKKKVRAAERRSSRGLDN